MNAAPKYHFITADKEEIKLAGKGEEILHSGKTPDVQKFVQELIKHPHLREALFALLAEFAKSGNVAIASSDKALSSQEAADLLDVSRPFMNKLLDANIIPSYKTGVHRRIYFKDVLQYKMKRDRMSEGMDILTEESKKLNLGWE